MSRNVIVIFGIILSLSVALFFLLFEKKEVLDTNWNEEYALNSKAPHSLYVFNQLLQSFYGEENIVKVLKFPDIPENEIKNSVFIIFKRYVEPEYEYDEVLENFIEDGGKVVLIGNQIYANISNYSFETSSCKDSLSEIQSKPFHYQNEGRDSFNFRHHLVSLEDTVSYRVSTVLVFPNEVNEVENYDDNVDSLKDNVAEVGNEEGNDILSDPYRIPDELEEPSIVNEDTSYSVVDAVTAGFRLNDSLEALINHGFCKVFARFNMGAGSVYVHSLPQLFTNEAAIQPFYQDHFNHFVTEMGQDKKIYFSSSDRLSSGDDDSPLQVLLKNRNLAAAYYCLLFGIFIYLLFGTKRRQTPIPVYQSKQNTSLEYVDTLSRLYEIQNQPHKLVGKMEENFYHDVAKRFFIYKNEAEFSELVSRKTKIDFKLINAILTDFQKIKTTGRCDEDQLINLHTKIEKFKILSQDGGRK